MAAHTWVTAELISATKLNTLETAAWNAGSVMTTLGDVLYGAASGTATRLAGNTTTTHKYLRSVGNGAASAAPTFAEITKVGTIDTGTWNAGAVTSSGTITATTIAGGSVAGSSLTLESTSGAGTTDYIAFLTGSQLERMRLLTGGTLLINGTAAYGVAFGQLLETNHATSNGVVSFNNWTATAAGSILDFNKARSGSIGIHTTGTPSTDDELGLIRFRSSNATQFNTSVQIAAYAAATPGTGTDSPGYLTISTTPDGSATPVEAMRIDSAQVVRLSGSTYTANGTVSTSGGNGTLTTASDERLKRIQGPYEPGLAEILKVKPIRYKWLPDIREAGETPEQVYAGFSAQNVRDALGDLAVGQRPDGILSLQDRAILGALVNAMKELSARNAALEARLAALEGGAPAAKKKGG